MRKELITLACVLAAAGSAAQNADEFRNPPAAYRPVPLWFWNNTPIERTEAAEQFRTFTQRDGYGGCAILPFGGHFAPEYLSDEYFALYGEIVREARPAELFYKVVSSSAANWDKRLVMSETFGAMGNIPVRELYTIAMEQYTKGINQLIPHAVWYNDADVTFLPELSYRNPLYNEALPAFNRFLARLNYLLQPEGRTMADIAMLYPIETLQAGHYLDGPEGYYAGGVKLPGTDYIRVAAMLSDTLARDFTYLHPEVLARCPAGRGMLHLDNKVNHQHYRVLILPGVKCISPECLRTVERFRRAGGQVIFTTALPETSTRFEVSATQVAARVQEMLAARKNPAVFLPEPDTESLRKALEADFIPDVTVSGAPGLRYIHRICGGRHIYYFANVGTETAEAGILLRDAVKLRSFDPHTGDNAPFAAEVSAQGTRLQLTLPGARSLFLVSE